MAGLTHRDTIVRGGVGLGRQTIHRRGVAGGATRHRHHIGMVSPWHPRCKSAGVASFAISRGRNVVGRFPSRIRAVVAARTVGRHRKVIVIDLGTGPDRRALMAGFTHCDAVVDGRIGLGRQTISCRGVAGRATRQHRHIGVVPGGQPAREAALVTRHTRRNRCWNVVDVFSSRIRAVVAARTIGGGGETAVVHLGSRPGAGGFVTGLTHRDAVVDGRSGFGGQTISCCRMTGGTTCCRHHIGMVPPWHPRCKSAGVASYTVSR